ncbi:MAG: DUF6443 domain-containing protein, partial [Bacteroidota bacterium]
MTLHKRFPKINSLFLFTIFILLSATVQGQCYLSGTISLDFESGQVTSKRKTAQAQGNCQGGISYYPSNYSPPSWMSVTLGLNGSEVSITVRTKSANTRSTDRQEDFAIAVGGQPVGQVRVVQEGTGPPPPPPPTCKVDGVSNPRAFAAGGDTLGFTLTTSNCSGTADYSFAVVSGPDGWLSFRQLSTTRFEITAARNTDPAQRTSVVNVTDGNGNIPSFAVQVTQPCERVRWYTDSDHDGFPNNLNDYIMDCRIGSKPGYTTNVEVDLCPDIEDSSNTVSIWYLDRDRDGRASQRTESCESPGEGWTTIELPLDDCDDDDPDVQGFRTWYPDTDGDGFRDNLNHMGEQDCGTRGTGWTTDPRADGCPDYYDPTNHCLPIIPKSGDPADHNYIYTRMYQEPRDNPLAFFTEDEGTIQDITYFDGLGRPMQQIGMDQTPKDENGNAHDIVSHMGYDGFGRMEKEWLPITDGQQSTDFGRFVTGDMEAATRTYYDDINTYGADFPNVSGNEVNPYSQKHFEPSPLNRVLKQAAPGEDWKLDLAGDDHSIEFGYHTNNQNPDNGADPENDNVVWFKVDFEEDGSGGKDTEKPLLTGTEFYPQGELYKNVTKDENHASTGSATDKLHTTEEFTDKQGRVVLKRTYATITKSDGTVSVAEPHDTYYVYDDYGNLTYVLPPKMEGTTATLANLNGRMAELGYQYVYDHRNRLVEKRIPGKGWEYIVYNQLDQPIMTQDANQREKSPDEWLFTKYDAFGRVAYTGKVLDNSSRTEIQTEVDAVSGKLWVEAGSFTNGTIDIGYGNTAYPTSTVSEVLTVNYYDDYEFNKAGEPTPPATVFGTAIDDRTQGLATGSKVRVLNVSPAKWITTVTRYDTKARAIYTYSENTYLGTVDIVESQLDFVGRPEKVRTSHTRDNATLVTLDNFTYDHVGRLLTQTQCIGDNTLVDDCGQSGGGGGNVAEHLPLNGNIEDERVATRSITVTEATLLPGTRLYIDPDAHTGGGDADTEPNEELIVFNRYDDLGQLIQKKVGGTPGTDYADTEGLQTVDYFYNIRGWLKQINNPASLGNDLFAFGINYNTPTHGGTALFNGNIAETEWKTANTDNSLKWYRYEFDALDRIKSAIDNTSDQRYSLTNVGYDKNGNITSLVRNGHTAIDGNGFVTDYGVMDDLTYGYAPNTNKLMKVADAASLDQFGFKDDAVNTVSDSSDDYGYDQNGNMIRDDNKGIVDVDYNYYDLPILVDFGGGNKVEYVYDAVGNKLKKKVTDLANGNKETDYANNFLYENGSLRYFNHNEGYVEPSGNGGFSYVFQYRDHLGNVRLAYSDNNDDGAIDANTEIISEKNYYPLGLIQKGYNSNINGVQNNYITYN